MVRNQRDVPPHPPLPVRRPPVSEVVLPHAHRHRRGQRVDHFDAHCCTSVEEVSLFDGVEAVGQAVRHHVCVPDQRLPLNGLYVGADIAVPSFLFVAVGIPAAPKERGATDQ